jgi:hypothetical protein
VLDPPEPFRNLTPHARQNLSSHDATREPTNWDSELRLYVITFRSCALDAPFGLLLELTFDQEQDGLEGEKLFGCFPKIGLKGHVCQIMSDQRSLDCNRC